MDVVMEERFIASGFEVKKCFLLVLQQRRMTNVNVIPCQKSKKYRSKK